MNEVPTSPLTAKREAAKLSQSALARRSGVSRNVLRKLESGGRCVAELTQLRALSAVLSAEPRELVGPGQAVLCKSREDLDEVAGERGWRTACADKDPRDVVAKLIGLDPADDGVRDYVEDAVQQLRDAQEIAT